MAVVRIDGRDHYLGRYRSEESWEFYYRLLAERRAAGTTVREEPEDEAVPTPLTVGEMIVA